MKIFIYQHEGPARDDFSVLYQRFIHYIVQNFAAIIVRIASL